MKQKIIVILVVLILLIGIYLLVQKNKDINIEDTKLLWEVYDMNIENIKNNLDSITNSNEDFFWWELKDFNIRDKEYQSTLNTLVSDIRMCYLELTDDGTLYTNSNPIRQYRAKKSISKKELESLNIITHNETYAGGCLNRFDRYLGILLSDEQENSDIFLKQVNKFIEIKNSDIYKNDDLRYKTLTYNEIFYRKIIITSLLEDLSEFINDEYYRLR